MKARLLKRCLFVWDFIRWRNPNDRYKPSYDWYQLHIAGLDDEEA